MADPDAVAALSKDIRGAIAILKHTQQALLDLSRSASTPSPSASSPSSSSSEASSALDLAATSATLIHAHATKISLLITTPPFTPSALSKVVRELASGPVTALAAAVQTCDPRTHTVAFRKELAWRSNRVANLLEGLLDSVPLDGKGRHAAGEAFGGGKAEDGGARGSIASTGVLWSACDDLKKLAGEGVGGFFVAKVNDWKATLEDVMEEMKEFAEVEPDDEDEEDDDEDENDAEDTDAGADPQDMIDDMFNTNTIPRSDPHKIRPRLDSSLRRLRLVVLFYQAFTKRRIKTLPTLPVPASPPPSATQDSSGGSGGNIASRLDEIAVLLQRLPEHFNNLQCAFYELHGAEIDRCMDECFFDAFAASELCREPWEGKPRDAFYEWAGNFQKEIKKA